MKARLSIVSPAMNTGLAMARRLLARRLALALVLLLVAGAEGRAASWSLRTPGGVGDGGPAISAEAYSHSGEARLSVGCTADGLLYSALELVGRETVASSLRVEYRVDGRNVISAGWPVHPREGALLLYQSNDVYLHEFARRLMRGNRLRLTVELLAPLRVSLDGSRDAISAVLTRCDRAGGGEGGDETPPEDEAGDSGAARDGPGEPTSLTR